MINPELLSHLQIVPFDTIVHQSPFGVLFQAVTTAAHDTLRTVLPLDANGCLAWVHSPDPVVADAECERVFSLVESTGHVIRFV